MRRKIKSYAYAIGSSTWYESVSSSSDVKETIVKKFLSTLLFALVSSVAMAQGPVMLNYYTAATFPKGGYPTNIGIVSDGNTSTDCTVGGGTTAVICYLPQGASVPISVSASSSSSTSATNLGGGLLGSAPFQNSAGVTHFIVSPTTSGHTFVYAWQPSGSAIAPIAVDIATYLASFNQPFKASTYGTATACASAASPAVCAAAPSGFVVVAAAATTVVVDTSVVTAASQIFLQEDSSLGTALSVTCNVTPATAPPTVSARVAATSFTITTTTPTTNPRCFSYHLVN
jgi:hypothetical protein